MDEVIKLIRASRTPDEAKEGLVANFDLSEIQAKAILEMRLQRLTGMEREKIQEEFDAVMTLITHLRTLLSDDGMSYDLIK